MMLPWWLIWGIVVSFLWLRFAKKQTPLSLIPDGSQYDLLRLTLSVVKQMAPQKYARLQPARVRGWVTKIRSGTRDAEQIRDTIVQHVMER